MDATHLTALGISKQHAMLYLAALSLGTASVQQLAEAAKIKRPTAHLYVQEMIKEGLLVKIPRNKREYYRAADPGLLEARAKSALSTIQTAIPELEALRGSFSGRPRVTVLEGEKGIRQIYAEVVQANGIRFWSNLAVLEKTFSAEVEQIAKAIQANGIRTREITADTPEARRKIKAFAAIAGKTYSAKAASDEIQNDNVIYGDVVALFRVHAHDLYVVRIEDPLIAASMKAIFDLAWKSAEPL